MSELINMTIKQLIMRGAIPFDVSVPSDNCNLYDYFSNEELDRTSKKLSYIDNHFEEYKSYNNINDLKKDLLSVEIVI